MQESLLRDVTDKQLKSAYQISQDEFRHCKIKQARFLGEIRTESKKYLLCPQNFTKKGDKGQIESLPFLIIPVEITHDGQIRPAGERPYIPRKYLQPNERGEVTISSVQQVQEYWRKNPFPEKLSWDELLIITRDFCESVVKNTVSFRRIKKAEKVLVIEDLLTEKQDATIRAIQYFYNKLLNKKTVKQVLKPLAKQMIMLDQQVDQSTLSIYHPHRVTQWGQMNPAYGLTLSQRQAVHHFLALQEGECLAIEGPPGTGKTTLLQSVIASQWVNEALAENEDVPVTLASSMTNLAIRNILDMFEGQVPLASSTMPENALFERAGELDKQWLPDVERLGAFCVSKGRQNEFQEYRLITRPNVQKRHFQSNKLDLEQLDLKQLDEMENFFLEKCEHYFRQKVTGMNHAKVLLHRRLRQIVTQAKEPLQHLLEQQELQAERQKIEDQYQVTTFEAGKKHVEKLLATKQESLLQIQEVREQWYQDRDSLSSVVMNGFMRLPWIGTYFQRRRVEGNRYFIERRLPDYDFPDTTDLAINQRLVEIEAESKQEIINKKTELKELQRLARRWEVACDKEKQQRETWNKLGFAQTIEELEPQLDKTYRVVSFWLATHYWEARFLLAVRKRLEREKNTYQSAEEFYRELAMISPCIVVTLHSAPRFLQDNHQHLHGFADLLIIDEASQALPELAFPAFAMAKKALVVGDTKQLPPIPSIDQKQDQQNLNYAGLDRVEQINQLGICSTDGSVMKWANRLTRYVEKDGQPFLLREHFRCHSQISKYFNQEFYQKQLAIHTNDRADFGLPPLAYAQVNGIEELAGNSRINHYEAVTIAWWVRRFLRQHKLDTKQKAKEKIAILTPFKAQANVIKQYLRKLQLADMLTVGTVHSLQGMEKEVIIFSPTYTAVETKEYFYDRDAYILNVAASRAKQSFLIFGDMKCFGVRKNKASNRLVAHCDDATDQLVIPSEEAVNQLLDRPSEQQNGQVKKVNIEENTIIVNEINNSIVGNKVTNANLRSGNNE